MNTLLLVLRLTAILCVTVLVSSFALTVTGTGIVWMVFTLLLGALASVVAVADYTDTKNSI